MRGLLGESPHNLLDFYLPFPVVITPSWFLETLDRTGIYIVATKAPTFYPFIFEGAKLPPFAAFLDVAASMVPVSEETAMWFWKFSICIGAPREERSKIIQGHATELLAGLSMISPGVLAPELAYKFPGITAEQIFKDWVSALESLIELAGNRKICRWHMEETPTSLATESHQFGPFVLPTRAAA